MNKGLQNQYITTNNNFIYKIIFYIYKKKKILFADLG